MRVRIPVTIVLTARRPAILCRRITRCTGLPRLGKRLLTIRDSLCRLTRCVRQRRAGLLARYRLTDGLM